MSKMKVFSFLCSLFFYLSSVAQSMAGITNQRDTSYTTYSANVSTKKTHPDIKIVSEFHFKTVKEKRNVSYCKIGDRKLLLDVFYPSAKTKGKRAAIMIIHGGG
jgi:hypothetical protein